MDHVVICLLEIAGADQRRIEAIRRRYDPQFGRLPAHVTLLFPTKRDNEARILADARRAAAAQTPFAMRLTSFEAVADPRSDSANLYLIPSQGKDRLVALHEQLTGAGGEPAYQPHVSVGKFNERTSAVQIARKLNSTWQPIEGLIRTLQVLRLNGGWIVPIADYEFSGEV